MSALISIITINFNNATGLENTIKSVASQSFKDVEHIVIDGNSTDGSKEIINTYQDLFSYWISEPDWGVYNAMNKGIKASRGVYLLFLNSGDTLVSASVLNKVSQEIEGGLDLYYGNLIIDDKKIKKEKIYPDTLSFHYFFYKGHLPHPATFMKRILFETISYYNEDYKIASDWEFMVCAICKYNVSFKHLNIFVANFVADGLSSDSKNRKLLLEEKDLILKNNFPLFINDHDRLLELDAFAQLNRFKMLKQLERYRITQKLNTIWLKMLLMLFNIKINRK